MGEGGANRALLAPPPALCPESSCAAWVGVGGRGGGRSGLAWRGPWAPAADWPVAQAAAGQARSWPGPSR